MQMIITSDNTATDLVFARVGGVPAVNTWLQAKGYAPALRLNATILEVFRNRYALADPKASELSAEDVYALGSGDLAYGTSPVRTVAGRPVRHAAARGAGREPAPVEHEPVDLAGRQITPRGVGRLLEAIETAALTSAASADEMRRVFRWQQSGAAPAAALHRRAGGAQDRRLRAGMANDVGIIYTRSGPVVVSFLLNEIREPYAEAEDRMGQVARVIVEYFDGR
jgi:hypothetical protein